VTMVVSNSSRKNMKPPITAMSEKCGDYRVNYNMPRRSLTQHDSLRLATDEIRYGQSPRQCF